MLREAISYGLPFRDIPLLKVLRPLVGISCQLRVPPQRWHSVQEAPPFYVPFLRSERPFLFFL